MAENWSYSWELRFKLNLKLKSPGRNLKLQSTSEVLCIYAIPATCDLLWLNLSVVNIMFYLLFFRSLNDGECSADWYNFQESVAHLQLLEEEVVESHKNLVDNMLLWAKQDQSLLAMSNEVDYDQDGKLQIKVIFKNNNQCLGSGSVGSAKICWSIQKTEKKTFYPQNSNLNCKKREIIKKIQINERFLKFLHKNERKKENEIENFCFVCKIRKSLSIFMTWIRIRIWNRIIFSVRIRIRIKIKWILSTINQH